MEALRLDTLAKDVVAWHNRHPLAHRIELHHVHSVGYVVLPFEQAGADAAAGVVTLTEELELPAAAVEGETASAATLRDRALARARMPSEAGQAPLSDAATDFDAAAVLPPPKGLKPVFSEAFFDHAGVRRVVRWALRHGRVVAAALTAGPVRRVGIDAALSAGMSGTPGLQIPLVLRTACIEIGPQRLRLLLGPGEKPAVLGPRCLSWQRAGVGASAVLTAGTAAMLLLAPSPQPAAGVASTTVASLAATAASAVRVAAAEQAPPLPASLALAASSASGGAPGSAAPPTTAAEPMTAALAVSAGAAATSDGYLQSGSAHANPAGAAGAAPAQLAPAPPAPAQPAPAQPAPAQPAPAQAALASAASAPAPLVSAAAASAPPATVVVAGVVDVEPQLGRVALPSLGAFFDLPRVAAARASRQQAQQPGAAASAPVATLQASAGATPTAPAASPPPAAPRSAFVRPVAATPTGPVYALSTRLLRTPAESEQLSSAMRSLLLASGNDGLRVEVVPVGDDWRVVGWPFDSRNSANRARALLVSRGLRVEVVDF
jgi:hypothetical protein